LIPDHDINIEIVPEDYGHSALDMHRSSLFAVAHPETGTGKIKKWIDVSKCFPEKSSKFLGVQK
jgi:hypothetical protein